MTVGVGVEPEGYWDFRDTRSWAGVWDLGNGLDNESLPEFNI